MLTLLLACLSPIEHTDDLAVPSAQETESTADGDDRPDGTPTGLCLDHFDDIPEFPSDPDDPGDPEDPEDPEDDCPEPDVDPWSLNVVVLENLGSSSQPYSSDFQGPAAVLGDVTTSGFTFAALGADVALFSGGDVDMEGSASGDIESAGGLTGTGTVVGDVYLGGSLSGVQVVGQVYEGDASAVSIDLDALADWFLLQSAEGAAQAATVEATDSWGEWVIETEPGLNVVELTSDELDDAWGVRVEGPGDLLINVPDADVTLDSLTWNHSGNVLLNLHNAETVHLSGGNHRVALLAPYAEVTFAQGLLSGHVVAGSLYGGGQVNVEPYEGPDFECPEENVGGPE